MSLPEKQESVINHVGWNFSNSIASMPIKKRRVPLTMAAEPDAPSVDPDEGYLHKALRFRSSLDMVEQQQVAETDMSSKHCSVMEKPGPSVKKGSLDISNGVEASGCGSILIDTKCVPNQENIVGERSLSSNCNMCQEPVDHQSIIEQEVISDKANVDGTSAVSAGSCRSIGFSGHLNNRDESIKVEEDFRCNPAQIDRNISFEDAKEEGTKGILCTLTRESRFHWDLNTSMETWDDSPAIAGHDPRPDKSNHIIGNGTIETEQSVNKNSEVEEKLENPEVHVISPNQMLNGSGNYYEYDNDVKSLELSCASVKVASSGALLDQRLAALSKSCFSNDLACRLDEEKTIAEDKKNISADAIVLTTHTDSVVSLNQQKTYATKSLHADNSGASASVPNISPAHTMSTMNDQVGDILDDGNCSQKSGTVQTDQCETSKSSGEINIVEGAFVCAEACSHNSFNESICSIESSGGKIVVLQPKSPVAVESTIGNCNVGTLRISCANGDPQFKTLSYPLAHPDLSVDSPPMSYEDEKINIFEGILDEDPYDSEYESDGCHAAASGTQNLTELQDDDDSPYEEGEFRESTKAPVGEGDEHNIEETCSSVLEHENVSVSRREEEDNCRIIVSDGMEDNHRGKDGGNVLHEQRNDPGVEVHVQGLLMSKLFITSSANLGSSEADKVISEDRALKHHNLSEQVVESKSDQAHSASLETITEDGQVGTSIQPKAVKHSNSAEATQSDCSTMKFPVGDEVLKEPRKGEVVSKELAGKTNKSRVINLGRPSDGLSRERKGSMPTAANSRIEREKCVDSLSWKDRHVQRNRDTDSSSKFKRDRNKDRTFKSAGSDSPCLRGRVGHLDEPSGNWDSERHYTLERQNGVTGVQTIRPRNAAMVAAAKLESDGFVVAPDGTIVTERTGTRVRAESKTINMSPQSFHIRQRRRLAAVREHDMPFGGMQMARQSDRCRSPDAEFHEFGSEIVVSRHGARFFEGLPSDTHDQAFSHQYASANDRHYRRGERSFSPVGRMGSFNTSRSDRRSPRRLRSGSPQLWLSPKRRSPDRSDGHHSPICCRSPPPFKYVAGFDRRRSPCQGSTFSQDMMEMCASARIYGSSIPRRHEEIREMVPMHRNRIFIPDRLPPGRLSPRSLRRFARVDSPERMDMEKSGRPLPPGRFGEFASDARESGYRRFSDERMSFVEKRGPVEAVRRFDIEDVGRVGAFGDGYSRPYGTTRSQVDGEFHSSSSRDFNRGIKGRLGTSPRKEKFREDREDGPGYPRRGWRRGAPGICHDDVIMSKRRRFDA